MKKKKILISLLISVGVSKNEGVLIELLKMK